MDHESVEHVAVACLLACEVCVLHASLQKVCWVEQREAEHFWQGCRHSARYKLLPLCHLELWFLLNLELFRISFAILSSWIQKWQLEFDLNVTTKVIRYKARFFASLNFFLLVMCQILLIKVEVAAEVNHTGWRVAIDHRLDPCEEGKEGLWTKKSFQSSSILLLRKDHCLSLSVQCIDNMASSVSKDVR